MRQIPRSAVLLQSRAFKDPIRLRAAAASSQLMSGLGRLGLGKLGTCGLVHAFGSGS